MSEFISNMIENILNSYGFDYVLLNDDDPENKVVRYSDESFADKVTKL